MSFLPQVSRREGSVLAADPAAATQLKSEVRRRKWEKEGPLANFLSHQTLVLSSVTWGGWAVRPMWFLLEILTVLWTHPVTHELRWLTKATSSSPQSSKHTWKG